MFFLILLSLVFVKERKHCGKSTSVSIRNKVLFLSKRENCSMIHLVPERCVNLSLKVGRYPIRESIFRTQSERQHLFQALF